jgi:hypothetical protein
MVRYVVQLFPGVNTYNTITADDLRIDWYVWTLIKLRESLEYVIRSDIIDSNRLTYVSVTKKMEKKKLVIKQYNIERRTRVYRKRTNDAVTNAVDAVRLLK